MLDVRRLRLLRELSRRGTISAVAGALSYSPSAVSQQLAILEREVGVPLLEPMGRRVRLTAQAELLVAHTGVVLAELERAEASIAASREQVSGRLRVASFQSALLTLLPPILLSLADAHAGLRVEVTEVESEASLAALVAGEFDIVLGEEYPGHPQPRPAEIERQDGPADELSLVLPRSWPAGPLAGLAGRPFVMEPPGSPAGEWAAASCRREGFEPDVQFTSTDLQIHLRLVESGLAAALLPDLAGASTRPSVQIQALTGRPARQIFTAVRRGASGHPAVSAFRAALSTTP